MLNNNKNNGNALYFGDNLDILRTEFDTDSVDLVYLDPPFNSSRDYNLLFKTAKGAESDAQIVAFEDTWHWSEQAAREFREIEKSGKPEIAELMRALRSFLKENDMMAYLTMMCTRLIEMQRVLRPTGTIFLHCDSTASHYLKLVLDAIFGLTNYRNEIIWRRSNPKSHITQNLPNCTDTIFRYTKSEKFVYKQPYEEHDPEYVESAYKYTDKNGRYRLLPLLNPNDNRPNLRYEFLGVTRVWRWTRERMEEAYKSGLVVQLKPGAVPQYKKYLAESKGRTLTNLWTDIEQAAGNEHLGYPTQKPLALLERIIEMASNEGDLVLDPFCGCGTAVHAAERLGRRWVGVDITHLSIRLVEKRLTKAFPNIKYEVHGVPRDIDAARDLFQRDPYQFQYWACTLVDAQPFKGGARGMDRGVDGILFAEVTKGKTEKVIVSVKGGENIGPSFIRDLKGVLERDKAAIGLYVGLREPTREMIKEATSAGFYESPHHGAFPRIQLLTVEGLLQGKEQARVPDMSQGEQTFKAAKKDSVRRKQHNLF